MFNIQVYNIHKKTQYDMQKMYSIFILEKNPVAPEHHSFLYFAAVNSHRKITMAFETQICWCSVLGKHLKQKKNLPQMGVSLNGGTPKSSILIGFLQFSPSILGYPYFWKHPYGGFLISDGSIR